MAGLFAWLRKASPATLHLITMLLGDSERLVRAAGYRGDGWGFGYLGRFGRIGRFG